MQNLIKRQINGIVISLIFICGCTSSQIQTPPILEGDSSLFIHVKNLDCCKGILRVAVYHDEAFWMSETGMVRGRVSMIQKDIQTIEIHGLPSGRYAVAVHQDSNSDGKLNRRFGFIPNEPYGFSNNVGKFGPAQFSDAALTLDGDKKITINLHHALSQ